MWGWGNLSDDVIVIVKAAVVCMFVLPLKVGVVMVVAMEIRVGVAVEMEIGVIVSLGRGDRVVGERECRCVW